MPAGTIRVCAGKTDIEVNRHSAQAVNTLIYALLFASGDGVNNFNRQVEAKLARTGWQIFSGG
jgi:hypothetical protein